MGNAAPKYDSVLSDTNAIIKRYVSEVGTAWITALVQLAAENVMIIARAVVQVELSFAPPEKGFYDQAD